MTNPSPIFGLSAFLFGVTAAGFILDLLGKNALWRLAGLPDAEKDAYDPRKVHTLQAVISALLAVIFLLPLWPGGMPGAAVSLPVAGVALVLVLVLWTKAVLRRFCLRHSREGGGDS